MQGGLAGAGHFASMAEDEEVSSILSPQQSPQAIYSTRIAFFFAKERVSIKSMSSSRR